MESLLFVSNILSYSVITMCLWVKLPQVASIVRAGNTKGLSLRGYWMDMACYVFGTSYAFYLGNPISTYAESILLAAQTAAIIGAITYYNKQWNAENLLSVVMTLVFLMGAISFVIPVFIIRQLHMLTLPLAVISKLSQIRAMYKIKSRGAVSTLTWAAVTYGCAARLFTTLVEVKDPVVFTSFLVSFVLNLVITLQCLYYGNPKTA